MKNKPKYGKVSFLPFYLGKLSSEKIDEIRKRPEVGLQPQNMDYRKAFITGLGASTKDPTWNRSGHEHTCCQSKVPWRHKAKCIKAARNAPDDLSDLTP